MASTYARWIGLLLYFGLALAWMDERPILEAHDGNLIISGAKDRNITFKVSGSGRINVNEINLLRVASAAQNATRLMERLRAGYLVQVEDNLERLTNLVEGPTGLQRRLALLEGTGENNGTARPSSSQSHSYVTDSVARNNIRRANERIRRLEDKVRGIVTKLKENDCQSNPCQNGGSCLDLYEGYQCHCTSGWEGPNCVTDINECARYLGTDLGCQNGATCFNLLGSYRCECQTGWFGLHCTKRVNVCSAQNSHELCGHGVCVPKPGSVVGYVCLCDQGWQTDGTDPACTKDVDECAAKHPPCSVNPPVICLNEPGTFFCGSCPRGYTGNGYYCSDIDECLEDNGGCSTSPRVQCINTMGSRVCGPCPPGYQGNGESCIYVGPCRINNGGCHPLANCIENPALTSSYVQCQCPVGYVGDGLGPNGCQPGTAISNNSCGNHPCVHGTCASSYQGFVCRCDHGYTGPSCNVQIDPCSPNPCKNNGVCAVSGGAVTCDCPNTYTGSRCETQRQTCGGVSRNPVGHLQFPIGGNTYLHGLSCAWVLVTNHTQVLNVTFTAFNLEASVDCKFDFLQIHDGRNAGSHMIGRFCGNTLPNTNGNIVSSHNSLYFWFHSDNTIAHDGFTLHWNSIEPVCGGLLEEDYGTITSSGYPGRYPPNRDCYWYIIVKEGKRIQFHFGQLMLEEHSSCEYDYIKITGKDTERLGLYCNHSRPGPLIVPGNEAEIQFHSDGSGQDAGFQIHYSTVEGIPGCGGILTSYSGTISSPGLSLSYEPNMNCEWKIQLPPAERIKITWLKFDLEESSSCYFDAVEIYDGDTTDSPLIGRYCGVDMPPTVKSTSNVILIVFTSDWSYQSEGFALSYDMICGGEFTEETGVITSPMYPNSYHSQRTCLYEIMVPPGKGVSLTIVDLDIEGMSSDCYFDYLEIFDGHNENSTLLATLCGYQTPSSPYLSTHNVMTLKFTSDTSVQGRGFKANYTSLARRCGGLYRAASGMIQTPSEDGSYGNNEECIWTIQAPSGYVVQLNWLSFSLEGLSNCIHDYVKVYDSDTESEDDLMGTWCGHNQPPLLITQSRTMTLAFRTDSTVTNDGFMANYVFLDASKICGNRYIKPNGVIRSPNYPNEYPTTKECVWVIEAPNKQKVTLTVNEFNLEKHSDCHFDYLEIRNGGYENSPLIGRYCGTEIPKTIVSQTNLMYVKFVSDSSRTETGFSIDWDSSTEGCGGTMTSASGEIVSPNYPQPYNQNAECTWKIVVAAGSTVQLVIVDLDLEHHARCRFDYVEISEGTARKRNAQRYCNNHPSLISMKSNIVTIRFRSDFTTAARGFHIKYETDCHNKVHGFWGVIESPNFPNNYDHLTNCSWIIDAPIGNKINITFSHFELEGNGHNDSCQYDYLEIKEGSQDKANTGIGRYCGTSELPKKIHSSQPQIFINFFTDIYINFGGFRLEWQVDGCGGHLTRPFDVITSPGYPAPYPQDVKCEWFIEVDFTHSIEITFYDINIEKQDKCSTESIKIYGGEDESGPKLAQLCHADKPVVYTSSGNKMFVTFESHNSYALRGFRASYKSVPSGCGGRFTAYTGVIHSANYPQNYPPHQSCEWLLQVDKNHVVNVTFEDFDIEDSRNCTDDYVKLYDGPTKDDYLMGTHCRNQLPPSYVSTSNEMLVVMRSDSIISAKGFKARYKTACGARIIVKDQGFLEPTKEMSLGMVNCTWTLIAENPADHVTLTFVHLELIETVGTDLTACYNRYVEVHEGEDSDGPSLGKWCTNKVPPAITSTGSALTVRLYSSQSMHGLFAATYSVLNSACGGNYTSEHGTIASPNYPNSYPLNSECVWILNTSPGNRISVTFSEFDLQQSENCDLDYLEIREGNGIGKLIGTYCGQEVDSVTSSSAIWIKFKSDSEGVAKGFLADYSYLGGDELSGPIGRITSPLYPLAYMQRNEFSWRITVDPAYVIRLEFEELHIENTRPSCINNFKIYDGYNEDALLLTEECGIIAPEPLETASNVAYIVMHIDNVRYGNWFNLNWLQIPKTTSEEKEAKKIQLSKCTEEVSLAARGNSSYTIRSPGWPHGYEHNLECTWLFTSPPGTHLVLRITSMQLEETTECVADYVAVYSGNALTSIDNAVLQQKLCLSNSTWMPIKTGNVMTVKFITDVYLNGTGFYGYVYRECGGELSGPDGVIEINNSTSLGRTSIWRFNCEWFVTVKPGRTIEVTISDLTTPNDKTCTNNYILVKNGRDASSPLLGDGKYCGDVAPAPLQTTGNKLYVKATGTMMNLMFKLTYREVGMECGGEITIPLGKDHMINSPNYPNIPHPFTECTWTIVAPAGERISIHFVDRFDLTYSTNCEREYVELRDGGTDSSKLMGKYCKDTAPSSLTTTGNLIYIHYYTDVAEPKNGFRAYVTTGDLCGGILRGPQGTIASPGYPHSYPKNQRCSWWIIGPVDQTLKIQFRDLHLPNRASCQSTDYVMISGRIPDNDTIEDTGTFCGQTIPDVVETTANEAFVTFHSDDRDFIPFRGFILNYTASREVCGGQLTAMSGIIKSPGYPNPRTRSRYCDWRIKLPLGYQVVVDMLDLGIVGTSSRPGYSLSFFNDFQFKTRIKTINKPMEVPQIRSSGNTMMIGYWASIGHRGFKLRYSSAAPAPCGGILTDVQGEIKAPPAPYNETAYSCEWRVKAPEIFLNSANDTGLTLTVKVTGSIGRCYDFKKIMIKGVGVICGNVTTPKYLRSPFMDNELKIINGTSLLSSPMQFNLMYQWQACGGVLPGPSHTISNPKDLQYPINCAWHVKYADNGEMISLSFSKLNLGSCENGHIVVRNGGPFSPKFGTFCGNLLPDNITSTRNELWIEYYAAAAPGEFEINLQLANHGCGGALRGFSKEIASPGFPKQYPNKAECTWDIMADDGYHVGLSFVSRFNLENSPNCEKDYVQVFDWKPKDSTSGGNWTELGKVCGRVPPQPFNSTTNRMRVTFRSNENVQGDGFRAIWKENCGGIFYVTDERKIIKSPGYPNLYRGNLYCNYTLISTGEDIVVKFLDFEVERTREDCRFDNLTVITQNSRYDSTEEQTWCGQNMPPLQRSMNRMEVIFKTDKYINRHGFQFEYYTSQCGGIITKPTEIRPLMNDNEYFGRLNCTWVVMAPQGKDVILRFEEFDIESSTNCVFDYVSVFNSKFIDDEKILGRVCGNLTEHLPVFKSNSTSMVIQFVSDFSRHQGSFSAKIFFGTSVAAGCGGTINLTSTVSTARFRSQLTESYASLEDCHWNVVTAPGKIIKLSWISMDIKTCASEPNVTRSEPCSCDYLQINDGGGQYSELLGKYCGNATPPPIVSSTNKLWIRFVSDGTVNGAGVVGTLEAIDSPCGLTYRTINTTKGYLTSPGYPHGYEPGVRCRWILEHTNDYGSRMQIRLLDLNITSSKNCEDEYLSIMDTSNYKYIDHGFGEHFVYSGSISYPMSIETGSRFPSTAFRFCGEMKSFDYHSVSNSIQISFKTTTRGKGFKLEYNKLGCHRNYTADETQGRIIHEGFSDCWITITTLPNRTIALYFNTFRLYDDERCTRNALQVREGGFSGSVLGTLCGGSIPNPIFSTGNKLSLHSWTDGNSFYESYDITYVTTDAGRGCGGDLFNYGGSFTSPMYPDIYRNNTVCKWQVGVPRGNKVLLKFTVFDIGTKKTCERNNVKLYDVDQDGGRLLRNTYCGEDDPALFEAEGNKIIVEYLSTVNNIGTGWVAVFMSQPISHPLEVVDW